MSFPFSAQGINIEPTIIQDNEKKASDFDRFRKDLSPDEYALFLLGEELKKYDIEESMRDNLKNKMRRLHQIRYLNVRYLAAALILLNNYNNMKINEEMFSFGENEPILAILTENKDERKNDLTNIKEKLFIYAALIQKGEKGDSPLL